MNTTNQNTFQEKNNHSLAAEFAKELDKQGFVVIRNIFSPTFINHLHQTSLEYLNQFYTRKSSLKKNIWDYSYAYDKVTPSFIDMYDFNGTDVLDIKKGRFDFAPLVEPDFPLSKLSEFSLIDQVVETLLGTDEFQTYYGLLESEPNSAEGNWHRDTLPLDKTYISDGKEYLEDVELADLKKQNYYFSLFIPLLRCGEENGGPAFMPGSHKISYRQMIEEGTAEVQPEANIGDVIIFSGTLIHRGKANLSSNCRPIIYRTWLKNWYKHEH